MCHSNGHGSSRLPYVGFPGLSLTPIQESPLLDSMLADDMDSLEREKWLSGGGGDLTAAEEEEDWWSQAAVRNGSIPRHWLNGSGREPATAPATGPAAEIGDAGVPGGGRSKTCSVNVHLVQATTFLPKMEPMTTRQKRAHVCKLLMFALCGFVLVAGIVLWIFSPAFT